MTCRELTELVTDYTEGRLGFVQRVMFQLHLGMCFKCRNYLRQVRQTAKTLGRLNDDDMPEDVRDALLEQFKNWKSKS